MTNSHLFLKALFAIIVVKVGRFEVPVVSNSGWICVVAPIAVFTSLDIALTNLAVVAGSVVVVTVVKTSGGFLCQLAWSTSMRLQRLSHRLLLVTVWIALGTLLVSVAPSTRGDGGGGDGGGGDESRGPDAQETAGSSGGGNDTAMAVFLCILAANLSAGRWSLTEVFLGTTLNGDANKNKGGSAGAGGGSSNGGASNGNGNAGGGSGRVTDKHDNASVASSVFGLLYLISPIAAVSMLPLTLIVEGDKISQSIFFQDWGLFFESCGFAILGGLLAAVLIVVEILLVGKTDAFSVNVIAIAGKVVQTVLSIIVFGEMMTPLKVAGLGMAGAGIFAFVVEKQRIADVVEASEALGHGSSRDAPIGVRRQCCAAPLWVPEATGGELTLAFALAPCLPNECYRRGGEERGGGEGRGGGGSRRGLRRGGGSPRVGAQFVELSTLDIDDDHLDDDLDHEHLGNFHGEDEDAEFFGIYDDAYGERGGEERGGDADEGRSPRRLHVTAE